MKKNNWIAPLVLSFACFATPAAHAQFKQVKLEDAVTTFRANNIDVSVFKTQVDMGNAHPVGYIGLFERVSDGTARQIPFEMSDEYRPFLEIRKGADCVVADVRLLVNDGKLKVLHAARRGEWSDKKKVTFTVYAIVENEAGMPGIPPMFLQREKQIESKVAYCDVNNAIDKELKNISQILSN
jgi:hypothetical protein